MKRALISVYHKAGIEKVAEKLKQHNWEIISTGGTSRYLEDNGINVTDVSDITKFPEILDGRVKTLHPLIFGPVLAKNTKEHKAQLEKHSAAKIDLVIVNFYPFEEALADKEKGIDYMIENIDIGGPSMVRAAAKNFKNTVVIVDRNDYLPVINDLISTIGLSEERQLELAHKAFSYTSFYDSLIARYFLENTSGHPVYLNLSGRKSLDLRYGENPHQSGALYITNKNSPLNNYQKFQGKDLSFNNILDLSMTYEVLNEFQVEDDFTVIVKHQNPCGAAIGNSQTDSFRKAFAGDSKSAFGGIVGFNNPLNKQTALEVNKIFFEVIIAPDFLPDALEVFKKKKNLRLIKIPPGFVEKSDIRTIPGGFVYQQKDNISFDIGEFELKTSEKLDALSLKDIQFGWKLIKFVKSNGIILVKEQMLIGVGAGQTSRVDAVELAINKCQVPLSGSTLISDAFFPFPDSIEIAARNKISIVVEPGGSVRDNEVIECAQKNNITLLFTGIRHFRH